MAWVANEVMPRGPKKGFSTTIFNLHISHTSIYHTYYKYYILQHIYIFYYLHTSEEILNTYTKNPSHGRHGLLLLNPFSQKAPRSHIKTLLLKGTSTSYKSPSLRRHNYFIQKPFSWKATLFIISQQLKEHCQRGNSFTCMIRKASLISPYTQLDILSLPPVALIFPFNLEVIVANCPTTAGVTLLGYYQLTEAVQLGLQIIQI